MINYINSETIEKIKESVDIVDVISDYIELKKTGANYVGLCPFHNEKTPSFTVSEVKQYFHCFGCGVSGDGIAFIMKKENLDFPDAVRFLADKQGIIIEEKEVDSKLVKERNKLFDINRDAARFFLDCLNENKSALNYLYRRDINQKIIRQFGLGFAPDSWVSLYEHLIKKGYIAEDIVKLGLIGERNGNNRYYDKFRNRIIFPIIDTKSRVIGFGGRVLDHTMPKYLNSKESPIFSKGSNLYGLNLINKYSDRKKIILVEGYMDVISLFSNGIIYGVASLGTALTEQQGKLLKRYGKEIYICYDSDTAGVEATIKAINVLTNLDLNPKIILLPKDMDPDDYIKKNGALGFEKLILKAINHIDYRILINRRKYDLNNIEDNIKFTIETAKLIKSLKSPIEQDAYIDKISKDTGISKEAIEKEINQSRVKPAINYSNHKNTNNMNKGKYIEPVKAVISSGHIRAELDLLKIVLEDRDFFEMVDDKLTKNDFTSEIFQEMYTLVKAKYSTDNKLDKEDLKRQLILLNIDTNLLQILLDDELEYGSTNLSEVVEDLVNRIVLSKLVKERDELIKMIEEREKTPPNNIDNDIKFIELFSKLTHLNNEIKILNEG